MIRRRVAILVFPDVEVLDFCGPFEVFSTTRLDEDRRREEPSPYEVVLVAEGPGPVVASGGLKVVPDYGLDDCPAADVLLVPGGWGTRREMGNARLLAWIAERGRQAELLASVCTGALLLGRAGLLDGKQATTHWKSLDLLRETVPGGRREGRPARRRGRRRHHLRGDLGRDRPGPPRRRPAPRRGRGAGDGAAHGISVPRGQSPAHLSRPAQARRHRRLAFSFADGGLEVGVEPVGEDVHVLAHGEPAVAGAGLDDELARRRRPP